MRTPEPEVYTPAEAAVLSRLSLKAVNNAIDKKTVPARRSNRGRLLDRPALIYLSLERRRAVTVGALTVDIDKPRREVSERVRELRRAERLITTDPETMGGNPVFRG